MKAVADFSQAVKTKVNKRRLSIDYVFVPIWMYVCAEVAMLEFCPSLTVIKRANVSEEPDAGTRKPLACSCERGMARRLARTQLNFFQH